MTKWRAFLARTNTLLSPEYSQPSPLSQTMARCLLIASFIAAASAFQLNTAPARRSQARVQATPQMVQKAPAAVGSLLAALALATANPALTHAAVEPVAVVRAAPTPAAAARR